MGALGLRRALLSSPYFAWLLNFDALTNFILEFISNYLANQGLVVLNLGAIYVEGELDQREFDRVLDQAITDIKNKGGIDKLTQKEIRDIDDAVIKVARKFLVINNSK